MVVRWIFDTDTWCARMGKWAIGTTTGMIAAISDVEAVVRLVGAIAATFCSVVMAAGIVVGWCRTRQKAKQ